MKPIYADCAAAVPPFDEALSAFEQASLAAWQNPSSIHGGGQTAAHLLQRARADIAAHFGCEAREIVLTSCGTESICLAVRGLTERKKGHIVTTAMEHKAVTEAVLSAVRGGCTATYLKPDPSGQISAEDVKNAIRPDTVLIAVMAASNETGVIQPVAQIGQIARHYGIPFFSDGVQIPSETDPALFVRHCDMMSFSGHKFGAVRGTGILYIKSTLRPLVSPQLTGGGQEAGLRSGTENVAGACSVAAALEQCRLHCNRVRPLRDLFEERMVQAVDGVEIIGQNAPRLPHISLLSFDGISGEGLVSLLDLHGVAASASSACNAAKGTALASLTAMGRSEEDARRAVRFSFSHRNTEEEMHRLVRVTAECVQKLRALHIN